MAVLPYLSLLHFAVTARSAANKDFRYVSEYPKTARGRVPALQAVPTRSIPWKNQTVRQQCSLFEEKDTQDLVTERSTQKGVFGHVGGYSQTETDSKSAAINQEGTCAVNTRCWSLLN